jgi:hypothetical protein
MEPGKKGHSGGCSLSSVAPHIPESKAEMLNICLCLLKVTISDLLLLRKSVPIGTMIAASSSGAIVIHNFQA